MYRHHDIDLTVPLRSTLRQFVSNRCTQREEGEKGENWYITVIGIINNSCRYILLRNEAVKQGKDRDGNKRGRGL
jgi:hypothetical protein